ncbi:MAG: helix-turn-helix transcriptional regulator [Bacteroidales bacterium]|nr:helix-turn-helix transcriptional regulator [Candidatus Equimonas enterica]
MKITDIVSSILQNKGITIRRFEKVIGCSDGVISRAIRNGTDIQAKWLFAIAEAYPDISAEWLLRGEGPMLRESITIDSHDTNVGAGVSIGAGAAVGAGASVSINLTTDMMSELLRKQSEFFQKQSELFEAITNKK